MLKSPPVPTAQEDIAVLKLIAEGKVIPPRAPRRIDYSDWTPVPGRGASIVDDVMAIRGEGTMVLEP